MTRILSILLPVLMVCGCGAQNRLYDWEKDEVRPIADAAICYGGHAARDRKSVV